MKKYAMVALLAVTLVLGFSASVVMAQDEAAPEGVGVQVVGVNYCLLCTCAKDEVDGAPADFAKINVLKVKTIQDLDGAPIEGFEGKTLFYLPTENGVKLMKNEASAGQEVTITIGQLFKDQNALLVEEFEAPEGGEWDELPLGSQSGLQVL